MNQPEIAIRLHENDNVLVARQNISAGQSIQGRQPFLAANEIPLGHKLACDEIAKGDTIVKYGQPIGIATSDIHTGEWVHGHNLSNVDRSRQAYEFGTKIIDVERDRGRSFKGYRRQSGLAGTRNYVAVISNVNCSASVSKYVARHFTPDRLVDYPNVDGVVAFTHHAGCAMQFAGQQHQLLNRVMGGIARHPNIGGYLLIGLGCEQATLDYLIDDQQLVQIEGTGNSETPITLTLQNSGGTKKTIEQAIGLVEQMLPRVNDHQREEIPASELTVATECGGSDGNSGISANPAVGVASDRIVACGGTTILSETTEVIGAEHLLTERAVSKQVGQKLLDRIEWWRWYANIYGEVVDNNRSAGNVAGGLTTIVEKSLGAVAKSGSTPLRAVYEYAERIDAKGLVLMDTPGFDPCSITGMVAGGANMVLFTTGRGSCYGCKPAPSIKIATNTPMYERMIDDMDINAGRILDDLSVEAVGEEIFEKVLSVASGEKTKSERNGIGDEEFVPWMLGPVL